MATINKIRLQKGDNIIVISGKEKGKTGTITATHPRENAVTVKGINIFKKHIKPNKQNPQGGIVDITKPIRVSKVAIVEPTSKKPSKIGFKINTEGSKTRFYKRTNKEIK